MEEEGADCDPVIMSLCMYVQIETSEKCVLSIIETVSNCLHEYLCIYLFGQED